MTAFDPIKCGGGGKSAGNMELLILGKIGTTQSDISNSWQHCWLLSARGTSERSGEAGAAAFGGSSEGTQQVVLCKVRSVGKEEPSRKTLL